MFSPPFSLLLLLSDPGAPVLNHGVGGPSTTVALTFVKNLAKELKRWHGTCLVLLLRGLVLLGGKACQCLMQLDIM